ncbi:MAG: hypothetical protein V7640_1149 [Betaproteobacteria bacterium]
MSAMSPSRDTRISAPLRLEPFDPSLFMFLYVLRVALAERRMNGLAQDELREARGRHL